MRHWTITCSKTVMSNCFVPRYNCTAVQKTGMSKKSVPRYSCTAVQLYQHAKGLQRYVKFWTRASLNGNLLDNWLNVPVIHREFQLSQFNKDNAVGQDIHCVSMLTFYNWEVKLQLPSKRLSQGQISKATIPVMNCYLSSNESTEHRILNLRPILTHCFVRFEEYIRLLPTSTLSLP